MALKWKEGEKLLEAWQERPKVFEEFAKMQGGAKAQPEQVEEPAERRAAALGVGWEVDG